MRSNGFRFVLTMFISLSAFGGEGGPKISDLQWLSGVWKSSENGMQGQLVFTEPSGGMMAGAGQLTGGDTLVFAELIRIQEKNGSLVLNPNPTALLALNNSPPKAFSSFLSNSI